MMVGFLLVFTLLFFLSLSSLLPPKRSAMIIVKKKDDSESGRWSDLPSDILNEIIRRLYFVDRIYFRATCTSWRLAHCDRSAGELPCLLTHNWSWDNNGNMLSICKYHYPSVNRTFKNKHIIETENWEDIFGASVCASKYGWLLLQKSEKTFLYNPFSREILKLPDMNVSFNRSTFSSDPTSPDCLFFCVQSSKSSNTITISTCQRNDLEWRTHTFDGFCRVIEDVVYSNKSLYCVFSGGVMGSFSIESQDWNLLTDMEPITGISIRYRVQMVESDGQLLLVCPSSRLHIFEFDWWQKGWVPKNGLGNRALFLGCSSFAISTSENTADLADKIYYHGDVTRFYSLRTHKSYQCSNYYPGETSRGPERIWIELPQL